MAKFKPQTATLREIQTECSLLKGSGYGHNMIGLLCDIVEKRFGEKESIKLYKKYQM